MSSAQQLSAPDAAMNALTRLIGEAYDSPAHSPVPAAFAPTVGPRRRKKLWELETRCHCPLVGSCLPVAEMRRLAKRAGLDAAEMSDYTLHTHVVGHCGENGEVARHIPRFLEERHAADVARFSSIRGEPAVLALWRQAMTTGDVAGPLWAAWSHADLAEDGVKAIYGEIHMLSHQIGAAARADLRRLEQLAKDNTRLHAEATALRFGLTEAERQRDRSRAELERRLACNEGMPVTITINVSPLQFRQRAFPERLSSNTEKTGMDPNARQLDLTERTVMEGDDDVVEMLNRIKSLGVRVALDGLVTGYSSLSRLSRLRLTSSRSINRSFAVSVAMPRAGR